MKIKDFYKLIAPVLALSVIASFVPASADDNAGGLPSYTASEGFSDRQGENHWYYQYRDIDKDDTQETSAIKTADDVIDTLNGVKQPLKDYNKYHQGDYNVWSVDGQWYYGSPVIGSDFTWPEADRAFNRNSARTFEFPNTGVINISTNSNSGITTYDDDMYLRVLKIRNGEETKIWPKDAEWQKLTKMDTAIQCDINGMFVEKGERIAFEANRGNNTWAINGIGAAYAHRLIWDPVITYTKLYTEPMKENSVSYNFEDGTEQRIYLETGKSEIINEDNESKNKLYSLKEGSVASIGFGSTKNFSLSFDYKKPEGNAENSAEILLGSTESGAYVLKIESGNILLIKRDGSQDEVLNTKPNTGTGRFSITGDDNSIKVSLNGAEVLSAQTTEVEGKFALKALKGDAVFDNCELKTQILLKDYDELKLSLELDDKFNAVFESISSLNKKSTKEEIAAAFENLNSLKPEAENVTTQGEKNRFMLLCDAAEADAYNKVSFMNLEFNNVTRKLKISGCCYKLHDQNGTINVKDKDGKTVKTGEASCDDIGAFSAELELDRPNSDSKYTVEFGNIKEEFDYILPSGDNTISELTVNGVRASLSGDTFSAELSSTASLTKCIIGFTVYEKASVLYNNTVLENGKSTLDLSSSVKLTVRAEDLSEKEYTLNVTKKKSDTTVSTGGGGGGRGYSGGGSVKTPQNSQNSGQNTGTNNTNQGSVSLSGFPDMKGFEWADEAVKALKEKGIVNGNENGEFEPERSVSRSEFIAMAVRAFNLLDENAECDFNDLNKESWQYKYVASAARKNIIKGIDDNSFGVDLSIKREDAAVILSRILGTDANATGRFKDNGDISDYAVAAVNTLAEKKIISGDENERFNPKAQLSRAECAKLIFNAAKAAKGL